jgi:hypothetical protein
MPYQLRTLMYNYYCEPSLENPISTDFTPEEEFKENMTDVFSDRSAEERNTKLSQLHLRQFELLRRQPRIEGSSKHVLTLQDELNNPAPKRLKF